MTITSVSSLKHVGQVKMFLIKGKIYRSIELLSSENDYYLHVKYINNKIDNLLYSISPLKANNIIDDIKTNSAIINYFQDSIRNIK